MNKNLKSILEFREKRDWKQFHSPKNIALSLVLEASEVLEIFQWSKNNDLPNGKKAQIKEELADVYYWLLLLSYDINIDLEKALSDKMGKNAEKYPADLVKGSSKKYTEYK